MADDIEPTVDEMTQQIVNTARLCSLIFAGKPVAVVQGVVADLVSMVVAQQPEEHRETALQEIMTAARELLPINVEMLADAKARMAAHMDEKENDHGA